MVNYTLFQRLKWSKSSTTEYRPLKSLPYFGPKWSKTTPYFRPKAVFQIQGCISDQNGFNLYPILDLYSYIDEQTPGNKSIQFHRQTNVERNNCGNPS